MRIIVKSIDLVVPNPASPVLADIDIELPDRGLALRGLAVVAAPKAPAGIGVLLPRYRRRSDGEYVPAVRFADRADTLAIANAVRSAWLNYRVAPVAGAAQ
jgi:hypothetical protein